MIAQMAGQEIIPQHIISKYSIEKVIKVEEGWSHDEKFRLVSSGGDEYLLRITADGDGSTLKKVFEGLSFLSKQGYSTPVPYEAVYTKDGKTPFILLSWVPGNPLKDIITDFDDKTAFSLGRQAGKIQRTVHSYAPKSENIDWYKKFSQKIERVIPWYNGCGFKLPFTERVIEYIHDNEALLKNRPVSWQHGDYHLGNFLITPEGDLGVIDFNRSSFGDPWEEYDRFIFTWSVSREFATGQLNSYFNDKVPAEFFPLMALYNAVFIISSIPWAVPYGEHDVQVMVNNANKIYESWDGFTKAVPLWYIDKNLTAAKASAT